MPRYYFHIRTGLNLERDEEGTDLPDLATARSEAIASAREIMADRLKHGVPMNGQRFDITDEGGGVVHILKFKDALT